MATWKGMRTAAEIKRERNIKNEVCSDNLYTKIEREEKVFQPLKIPRALQEALPYKIKPKKGSVKMNPEAGRVAVVLDHKERKIENAFKMLRELHGDKMDKMEKDKEKRMAKFSKMKYAEEERKMKKQKEARQRISRMMSKKKMADERRKQRSGK